MPRQPTSPNIQIPPLPPGAPRTAPAPRSPVVPSVAPSANAVTIPPLRTRPSAPAAPPIGSEPASPGEPPQPRRDDGRHIDRALGDLRGEAAGLAVRAPEVAWPIERKLPVDSPQPP